MEDNRKKGLAGYEEQFYEGITSLVVKNEEDEKGFPKMNLQAMNTSVKKQIDVDIDHLAEMTEKYVARNEKQTDEQIAIRLLEDMVESGRTRLMRKIAKEMLKEKWWMKK